MVSITHRYGRAAAVLAVAVCLVAACGDAQDPAPAGSTPPATSAPPSPEAPTSAAQPTPPASLEPTDPPEGTPGPAASDVEAAVADLAEHLGVPAEDVTVVSQQDVTWPDGALGCPEPGMAYTQALVPGSRVVLEVGGVQYPYHGATDGPLVRCDRTPQPPVD